MSKSLLSHRMMRPVQASLGSSLARDLTSASRFSGARRAASSMPLLLQKSFWKQMVPKPFRKSNDPTAPKRVKSKDWNPATFFICIFLLIGSMSIQQIALKKSFETFMRQSDVRIGLLREVVEKLQKGEEVDVEKVLGTGDAEKEIEWQQGRISMQQNIIERSYADFHCQSLTRSRRRTLHRRRSKPNERQVRRLSRRLSQFEAKNPRRSLNKRRPAAEPASFRCHGSISMIQAIRTSCP